MATTTRTCTETMGMHSCKAHGNAHLYVRHIVCGHEYCPLYWLDCPRCHGDAARIADGAA